MVHEPWIGSTFFLKNKSQPKIQSGFAESPLSLLEINSRSTNFLVQPEIRKIFTKRSLASEKSTKIAPKLQKFISFPPQLKIQ
jgi:hypothetical protein